MLLGRRGGFIGCESALIGKGEAGDEGRKTAQEKGTPEQNSGDMSGPRMPSEDGGAGEENDTAWCDYVEWW